MTWNSTADGADYGQGMALQSDGKLVITGFSHNGNNEDMLVLRLPGSADTPPAGKVVLPAKPFGGGISSLSLEQNIGQMVITGFVGTMADDPTVLVALDHVRKAASSNG